MAKRPCVQWNLSTNRGVNPNHHSTAGVGTWRRSKLFITEFDRTHHITYIRHAESEYQAGFLIKWTVFVWESREDDIVFELRQWACERGSGNYALCDIWHPDITTLFLGWRPKYKMYIHQNNSYWGRRTTQDRLYVYIFPMSSRSKVIASWEQCMLPAWCRKPRGVRICQQNH